jgi:hypothetical protein
MRTESGGERKIGRMSEVYFIHTLRIRLRHHTYIQIHLITYCSTVDSIYTHTTFLCCCCTPYSTTHHLLYYSSSFLELGYGTATPHTTGMKRENVRIIIIKIKIKIIK